MSQTSTGKTHSNALTEGPSRAAARSYLRGVGFSKEDLHKPIIGIANTWTEIGPCNFHLRQVAEAVKQGVREAGGTFTDLGGSPGPLGKTAAATNGRLHDAVLSRFYGTAAARRTVR